MAGPDPVWSPTAMLTNRTAQRSAGCESGRREPAGRQDMERQADVLAGVAGHGSGDLVECREPGDAVDDALRDGAAAQHVGLTDTSGLACLDGVVEKVPVAHCGGL